jgi:hypothetical protein
MRVPSSLAHEHDELHIALDAAARLPGRTGETARTVVRIMQPHFIREQDYATPPLGLLPRIVEEKLTPTMAQVLPLTERLKAELPLMLEEHRAIVAALEELVDAARAEERPEVARFAQRLMLHAQIEEEILYPAAILVGEYLKLKLPSMPAESG